MAQTIIQAEKLVKKFGNFTALNKLDLSVEKGEVHGFLGPNGSGKSTTIRVLLGLMKATDGNISLFGQDPWKDSVKLHRRLSYVPGDVSLWPSLSGGEVIDLFTDLRGGINQKLKRKLLDDFQLDPRKKCRTYSKGNRQKVALVAALASEAELYILDEPTSGLDPLMESVFQSYIKDLKRQNKTVLLSSHILAEVEVLADRVTIIRDGKTVENGTLSKLQHLSQQSVKAITSKPPVGISQLNGVSNIEIKGNQIKFTVDQEHIGAAIDKLTSYGVKALTSESPSLEELFMRHYEAEDR